MPKIPAVAKEARRESILRATVECLARDGYGGTNMRTIAAEAGLTKGGLYAYFDSKESILLEVARHYMDEQLHAFAALPGEGAREQLHRVLGLYAHLTEEPGKEVVRRAILDLWSLAGDLPGVRESLEERYRCYLSTLSSMIRRGQAEGTFRPEADPEHVAGLILAARDGMVLQGVRLKLPVPVVPLTGLLRSLLTLYLQPEA